MSSASRCFSIDGEWRRTGEQETGSNRGYCPTYTFNKNGRNHSDKAKLPTNGWTGPKTAGQPYARWSLRNDLT